MIIVIPFTGQSHYTDALTSAMVQHGGLGIHRLVVVASSENIGDADAFMTALKPQFLATTLEHVKVSGASMERLFRDGLLAAARITPGQQEVPNPPVMWLEPGWIPNQRDWATTVSSEFYNVGGGARILGVWSQLPDMKVGNGFSQHILPGGFAPDGVTVFPSPYLRASGMIRSINNASDPWRKRLQFEITQHRVESTTLIEGVNVTFVGKALPDQDKSFKDQFLPAPEPVAETTPEPVVEVVPESEPIKRQGAIRRAKPVTTEPADV